MVVSVPVPGNIQSGVSGNDSIVATGVFSAQELLRVTKREYELYLAPTKFNRVQLVVH